MSTCIVLFSYVINLVFNLICVLVILSESELCNLNCVGNQQQPKATTTTITKTTKGFTFQDEDITALTYHVSCFGIQRNLNSRYLVGEILDRTISTTHTPDVVQVGNSVVHRQENLCFFQRTPRKRSRASMDWP